MAFVSWDLCDLVFCRKVKFVLLMSEDMTSNIKDLINLLRSQHCPTMQ